MIREKDGECMEVLCPFCEPQKTTEEQTPVQPYEGLHSSSILGVSDAAEVEGVFLSPNVSTYLYR